MDDTGWGQKFLDDIQVGTFAELLAEVASESSVLLAASPRSGNAPGDGHGANQDVSGDTPRSVLDILPLARGNLVEIQGAPGSGKTHLVYLLIATHMLCYGRAGCNKATFVFDTDGSFDVSRLQRILETRIQASSEDLEDLRDLPTAESMLWKLHIFRPTSSAQLAISLAHIPAFHRKELPEHQTGLVVIDSVSSFYWPDRYTSEQLRGAVEDEFTPTSITNPLQHVLAVIQDLRRIQGAVFILTNWGLNQSTPIVERRRSLDPIFFKQHLYPFPAPVVQTRAAVEPHTNQDDANGASTAGTTEIVFLNPSHKESTLPPLTHQITLHPSTTQPPAVNANSEEDMIHGIPNNRSKAGIAKILGYVRSSGDAQVTKFLLRIDENGVEMDSGFAKQI